MPLRSVLRWLIDMAGARLAITVGDCPLPKFLAVGPAAASQAFHPGSVDVLFIARDEAASIDLEPWLPMLSDRAVLAVEGGPAIHLPSSQIHELETEHPSIHLEVGEGLTVIAVGQTATERIRWLTHEVAAQSDLKSVVEEICTSPFDAAAEAPTEDEAPSSDSALDAMPIPRGHKRVHLAPSADLVDRGQGSFTSTGGDPQLWLSMAGRPLPRGWSFLSFEVMTSDPPLQPTLYVFHGPNGEHMKHYRCPLITSGRFEMLVRIPQDLVGVRLDPLDQPGEFTLGPASLRRVGTPRLLASTWRRDRAGLAEALRLYRREGTVTATDHLLRLHNPSADVLADVALALEYRRWLREHDRPAEADRQAITAHIAQMRPRPLISVVMPVYNTIPEQLTAAIQSVQAQLYPDWELCIADDHSPDPAIRPLLEQFAHDDPRIKVTFRETNGHIAAASNSALELVTGSFVALLDHDDLLAPHALYCVAAELEAYPNADILYSDEDKLDGEGVRGLPTFKTAWDPDRFLSQNTINHLGVYRTALMREVGGFREGMDGSQDYDLALRVVGRTEPARIRHLPFILYHWRIGDAATTTFSTQNMDRSVEAARRALREHLERTDEAAGVEEGRVAFWHRVRWALPRRAPHVTVIVPTRDRVGLVRTCVDGLLHRTAYENLDVMIVDNGSVEPETRAYFAEMAGEPRFSVLPVPGEFNFSALNNRAVERAVGTIVAFVNNDIDVIEAGWLEEMVSQASRAGVGAVGARLLYGDGTVQHAGICLGTGGIAGHFEKYAKRSDPGYMGQLSVVRNVSGVTAACLLMPKAVFEEIGGFDEENLKVAFNDVDLCLRIRAAGYRIVVTPYAELYHLESISRGSDQSPEKAARFNRERDFMESRWGQALLKDPFLSPNIGLRSESTQWAFPPRTERPWERFKTKSSAYRAASR